MGVGAKMHEGSYALLVGGQGVTVMLFIGGWLAEGGGVWGDRGAADDYLVAAENHVDEC